jgi:hypothetical protein
MKPGGFPERIVGTRWRLLFLGAALVLLATITRPGPRPPPPGPGTGTINAAAVLLDSRDPRRRDLGALRFLAGWSLESGDRRFGGISAMHVEAGEVTALSDIGVLIRFPVPVSAGILRARFDPLVAGPGPRSRKSNRDTEAMVIDGPNLWVAFERHNMVWRYDRLTLAPRTAARPRPMRRWRGNRGPEAMVRLADGRFLILAEGNQAGDAPSAAALLNGDPALPGTSSAPLRYRRPAGYRATDAALMPDGRILILSRRFTFPGRLSARLTLAEVAGVGAGATIEGREIAALAPPLTVDNMEALSVTRENGRTIVWIASDDNFGPLQRTLLLKFELRE